MGFGAAMGAAAGAPEGGIGAIPGAVLGGAIGGVGYAGRAAYNWVARPVGGELMKRILKERIRTGVQAAENLGIVSLTALHQFNTAAR